MEEQTFNFMTRQEIEDWAKNQDIVKINCIKVEEEDKFILTVGQYSVTPHVFNSREEAEQYLKDNFKLTNLDLTIIGAMCQRLNELKEEQLKNKEK